MGHELKKMQARHTLIVDRAVAGKTRKEIADELGMSGAGISNILQSPIVQAEISRRRRGIEKKEDDRIADTSVGAREILDDAATQAAMMQVIHIKSGNERVSQIAAMDILDRTGYPKVSKSETKGLLVGVQLDGAAFERLNAASLLRFGKPIVSGVDLAEGSDQSVVQLVTNTDAESDAQSQPESN